jgi:hypothetical protein
MTKVGYQVTAIILILKKMWCGEKRFLGSTGLNIITINPASVAEVMSAVMDHDLI